MTSPDRYSTCKYCKEIIKQTGDGPWTRSKLGGLGDDPECVSAPNPDYGPMPGHEPGVIAERPMEWSADPNLPKMKMPQIPWIPRGVNG